MQETDQKPQTASAVHVLDRRVAMRRTERNAQAAYLLRCYIPKFWWFGPGRPVGLLLSAYGPVEQLSESHTAPIYSSLSISL